MNEELQWSVKKLEEIDALQLYALLKLRADVFIIEQDCIYPDMDDKDQKALHVIGTIRGKVVAYTRIFAAGDYAQEASFGRVVIHPDFRGHQIGHLLVNQSTAAIETHFGPQPIKISAQEHLTKFYQAHGFEPRGVGYLEDGIPHIAMLRDMD
ncbi:MAG: GNAT family N-acetyltransferase [Bacteroidota bacterium]